MVQLDDHPTVKRFYKTNNGHPKSATTTLDAECLRKLCLEAGADDVGFVEINRPEIADQRNDILAIFPQDRGSLRTAGCASTQPGHGVPDGDGPFP